MSPVEDYLPEWEGIWEESGHKPAIFFRLCRDRGLIDQELYAHEIGMLVIPPEEIPLSEEAREILGYQVKASLWSEPAAWFATAWREFLKAFWSFMAENIPKVEAALDPILGFTMKKRNESMKDLLDIIWGHIKATFEQYWPPVQAKIEDAGLWIYNQTNKALLSVGEVTPERAPEMALKMFGVALLAGITAHTLSVGFEMIHPFKELGFHQMTGMVAQLGAFGPVAAATLGQVHYAALRRPMSYAVNKVTRSQIPDDQLLQIMAVKPDIPMELFIKTMQYHGYSDFWIERIKATMYHEPRYFELKMMAEDESAAKPPSDVSDLARAEFARYGVPSQDQWLFMKARRAGYSPEDSLIFTSSIIKGATRDQRKEYYKQGFNLFKEGYIQREHLNKILAELQLRPEASVFAVKSAELAYLLDTISDEVKYWIDSFLKDLVTDDELELQLSLLGVNRWRVDLMVRRAKVRKYKKPGEPVATEAEKAMNQVRSKYSQGYVALYRKDLIDVETLYAYLLEIGIVEDLAGATCFLEQARKAEKEVIA